MQEWSTIVLLLGGEGGIFDLVIFFFLAMGAKLNPYRGKLTSEVHIVGSATLREMAVTIYTRGSIRVEPNRNGGKSASV